MGVRIVCPACRAAYPVPGKVLGKKIKCPECGETILAAKRRPPKGQLSPLMIVAATVSLLIILAALGVGAYVVHQRPGPANNNNPPPEGGPGWPPAMVEEQPLMERQPQFEAHYREPEEPPLSRLEFSEPPPGDKGPEPVANVAGPLAPAVLKRIKEATVYLQVQMHQAAATGSGFFAGEPGFVITNAHVVGMLGRGAPPPASIKVVRNKGEKDEVTLTAQVVAVDPDADLAVLSVPKDGLPAPLPIRSAESLRETQPVYVAGFPLGELPGKNVTVNEYKLSSFKKEKGVLDRLQIDGNMLPGNSGGPVLDAGGSVVGVCVSILRNTNINFAIPGDKVLRFLDGRLAELSLGTPARADGGLRVPLSVRVIDPLGRLSRAAVDYWVGPPGPSRPGSRTPPRAGPGDGPRQTLTMEVRQQVGRGELVLPPLPAGRAYWLQPSLSGRGAHVWLSAEVYRPPEPVERKPARLAWQPPAGRPVVLERWSALHYSDPQGHDYRALLTAEIRLTDKVTGRQGDNLLVQRQFTGFKEGASFDGQAYMTTRLRYIVPNLKVLADNLVVDPQGTTQQYGFSMQVKDADAPAKPHLLAFQQDVERFLQALDVPLPGKEVQPGETWSALRPLPIDGTWKAMGFLVPQVWAVAENESVDVTYTYEGLRGADRAVIRFRGQQVPQPSGLSAPAVPVTGLAVVDLPTGQVVEEEATALSNVELAVLNAVALRAQGTVVARLRRE